MCLPNFRILTSTSPKTFCLFRTQESGGFSRIVDLGDFRSETSDFLCLPVRTDAVAEVQTSAFGILRESLFECQTLRNGETPPDFCEESIPIRNWRFRAYRFDLGAVHRLCPWWRCPGGVLKSSYLAS